MKPDVGGYNYGANQPLVVVTTDKNLVLEMEGKRKPRHAAAQISIVDMVVATISPRENAIVEHTVDSRYFEPWPYPIAED